VKNYFRNNELASTKFAPKNHISRNKMLLFYWHNKFCGAYKSLDKRKCVHWQNTQLNCHQLQIR